jgi:hypothetical protein
MRSGTNVQYSHTAAECMVKIKKETGEIKWWALWMALAVTENKTYYSNTASDHEELSPNFVHGGQYVRVRFFKVHAVCGAYALLLDPVCRLCGTRSLSGRSYPELCAGICYSCQRALSADTAGMDPKALFKHLDHLIDLVPNYRHKIRRMQNASILEHTKQRAREKHQRRHGKRRRRIKKDVALYIAGLSGRECERRRGDTRWGFGEESIRRVEAGVFSGAAYYVPAPRARMHRRGIFN